MLRSCLLLLARGPARGKRKAASLGRPDLDVPVEVREHGELLKGLLFELELAVEADHRAEQESQGKHPPVVGLVVSVLLGPEPLEVKENDVHALVVGQDGLAPQPDALGARLGLLPAPLGLLVALAVLVVDFELPLWLEENEHLRLSPGTCRAGC